MSLRFIGLIILVAGAVVSCGTSGDGAAESSSGITPISQRLNQEQGYVRDADGNWIPRNNRRSQYDSIVATGAGQRNNSGNRRFKANEYQAAEWTRAQSAPPQGYTGNTDGSAFQTTAAAQGQKARQSGSRARTPGNYKTGAYATGRSRENDVRPLDRPQNDRTENQRGFQDPLEIIDWRQQRDLSVDQSRSMLSR